MSSTMVQYIGEHRLPAATQLWGKCQADLEGSEFICFTGHISVELNQHKHQANANLLGTPPMVPHVVTGWTRHVYQMSMETGDQPTLCWVPVSVSYGSSMGPGRAGSQPFSAGGTVTWP
ncbi:hypothetical protein B0H14DRAFT_2614701 [Mycena olivaceomarginata]|nr:hypothetical protein B0H14DRAFT_2614701 [Mycena olivaceomarginata]